MITPLEFAALIVALAAGVAAYAYCLVPETFESISRGQHAARFRGQYSLRSLMILLAVGPPLLGVGWSHRDVWMQSWDKFAAPATPPRASSAQRRPKFTNTAKLGRSSVEANREQAEIAAGELHSLAFAGMVVFYPLTVLLLGSAFCSPRSWRRSSKATPLIWSAIMTSAALAAAFVAFLATIPNEDRSQVEYYQEMVRTRSVEIPLKDAEIPLRYQDY